MKKLLLKEGCTMKTLILVALLVCVPTGAMGRMSAGVFKSEIMEELGQTTYCMGFLEASGLWTIMARGITNPEYQKIPFSAKTLCSHMRTLYRKEKFKDKDALFVAVEAFADLYEMTIGELLDLFSNKSCEKP